MLLKFYTVDKRKANTISSLIIIAIWFLVIFLIAYPTRNTTPKGFHVYLYCILTLAGGLMMATATIIGKFIWPSNYKERFFYTLSGTLNICLVIVGLILFITNYLPENFLVAMFLVSFLIGIYIIKDIHSRNIKGNSK